MLTFSETVPSPLRIGLDLIGIDEGAPLELDLRIESVSEGVLVTGTVFAPTSGECVRCLTPITGEVEIDLTELFAYPNSATDETTESDEIGRVGASGQPDTVDLEQPIIDAIYDRKRTVLMQAQVSYESGEVSVIERTLSVQEA